MVKLGWDKYVGHVCKNRKQEETNSVFVAIYSANDVENSSVRVWINEDFGKELEYIKLNTSVTIQAGS